MTVETRDILLKAAEDVQSGMWCKRGWFVDESGAEHQNGAALWETNRLLALSVEEAMSMRRCGGGSILLATALLGGDWEDANAAIGIIDSALRMSAKAAGLPSFNDEILPDDPFEAGQQLAELFRQTAEAL